MCFMKIVSASVIIASSILLLSCKDQSYSNQDWEQKISEYHSLKFKNEENRLNESFDLYVDYSTCVSLAMNEPESFLRKIEDFIINKNPQYFSIKGNNISREDGRTADLLRTIKEVNYADLKSAFEKMADSDNESLIITDCEYFQKSIAKGNIKNPYFANALKKWLLKGHDIHVISEPYVETYKGKTFNKKRFYIFFTDRGLTNNIYNKISEKYDSIVENQNSYHLSCSHATIEKGGRSFSNVNQMLSAKVNGFDSYETQSWQVDWQSIETLLVYPIDPQTGDLAPKGGEIFSGLNLSKNCLLGFSIGNVELQVTDITSSFSKFADPVSFAEYSDVENFIPNYLHLDNNNGALSAYFENVLYDPSFMVYSPYNYLRLDLSIKDAKPVLDGLKEMFTFQSIDQPGLENESAYASFEQCLMDDTIKNKVKNIHLYSIYLQTLEHDN